MKTQPWSRTLAMMLGCLVLTAVGGTVSQSAEESDRQDVAIHPVIQLSADGVAFMDDRGVSRAVTLEGTWRSLVRQIRLLGSFDAEFHVEESLLGGKARTLYTTGDTCLVFERELNEPAPVLQVLPSPGGSEIVVQPQGGCGGCATFGDRSADLENWNCGIICNGCTCTHCISTPCPSYPVCDYYPSFPGCDGIQDIQGY